MRRPELAPSLVSLPHTALVALRPEWQFIHPHESKHMVTCTLPPRIQRARSNRVRRYFWPAARSIRDARTIK